jgi:cytochrome c oxidase subunit 1
LALTLQFIWTIFDPWGWVWASIPIAIALTVWFWPKKSEPSME